MTCFLRILILWILGKGKPLIIRAPIHWWFLTKESFLLTIKMLLERMSLQRGNADGTLGLLMFLKHRNFSRSDSSVSEDGPKERVFPPSPKEPTNSLRIDRFLRPFTLKAVQELLGKTGNVTSFWMDTIKTHCYVSYGSVEEAAATREAVYNLQWPPNGGRLLTAEFVGPEEVKAKLEAPQSQTQAPSQPPPTALPPPPPLTKAPPVKERHVLPPPLPLVARASHSHSG